MYQNVVMPGSASTQQTVSSGLQVGLGTRSAATEVLQNQGDFTTTGNQLDLAIQGNGFFQVTLPNGRSPIPAAATSSSIRKATSLPRTATRWCRPSPFPAARPMSPSAATAR